MMMMCHGITSSDCDVIEVHSPGSISNTRYLSGCMHDKLSDFRFELKKIRVGVDDVISMTSHL